MKRCIAFALAMLWMNAHAAEMKPWMLEKGRLVFAEDFSGGLDSGAWNAAKGTWTVEGGTLKGVELAGDHHAAVVRREAPMRNVVIQFDFRLDGCAGFSLSMNHDGGHNSRVVFTTDGFSMKKDPNKKDPADFSALLGECAYAFEAGKWYTMLVEYHGEEMLARVGDTAFILGTHPYIDQERTSIGFPVSGDSASFDNVQVWEGTLQTDWPARRKKLAALQQKRPGIDYKDPKAAWQATESKVRLELMQNDPAFQSLVQKRVAIDVQLKTTYPKAFRKNAKGAEERAMLLDADPAFKQLTRALTLARKAEREYMLEKNPRLAKLSAQMNEARKPRN